MVNYVCKTYREESYHEKEEAAKKLNLKTKKI